MAGWAILCLIALCIAGWMLITQAIVVIAPYIAGAVIIAGVIWFVWQQAKVESENDEGP